MTPRKPHAASAIATLSREQQQQITAWLLDENISYRAAASRVKTKFGIDIYHDSFRRFYRRRMQDRNIKSLLESARETEAMINSLASGPEQTYRTLLTVVGQIAFALLAQSKSGRIPDLKPIHDTMKVLIAARREELQRTSVTLDREKWEFDAARLCALHHAELQAIAQNDSYDETARIEAIRRSLFGDPPAEFAQLNQPPGSAMVPAPG